MFGTLVLPCNMPSDSFREIHQASEGKIPKMHNDKDAVFRNKRTVSRYVTDSRDINAKASSINF